MRTIRYAVACALAASLYVTFPAPAALAAPPATAAPAPSSADAALIGHGAYLARVADCVACHTAKDGKPFAGGLRLQTPIGAIYSTNITPDKETGIGGYSLEDFDRALRQGISKRGYTLYPAMPYPSYARVAPDDVKALYAFFMHGVAPVHQPARASDIRWPLSMRWPLGLWRQTFAPAVTTESAAPTVTAGASGAAADAAMLARGRYLVEGLGHCGACHTARGMALQETALTDSKAATFLGGGEVEHWFANNLRSDLGDGLGRWSQQDIVTFLQTGRNDHSAAFGGMHDVVVNSTQHMSDVDLNAIAVYLLSLKPATPGAPAPVYDATAAKQLHAGQTTTPGALEFLNNCAACHRSDGKGYAGVFPTLALSSTVNAQNPASLIHIVLRGSSMPATKGAPTVFTMPDFASRLTDQQVADVVTFIRSSWGNRGSAVSAATVSKIRAAGE
ncbi:cytochrome c [Burkholderia sp. SRS-W-2-2016]|uniref:cytochrome c n=1 Tax=Burkholderia sp. SRS-W-2-2016 TaxID=1926878 RepID=UPI0009F831BC|nr:cytochrome c [Burkholderia sp. SRS-W-2-2016]